MILLIYTPKTVLIFPARMVLFLEKNKCCRPFAAWFRISRLSTTLVQMFHDCVTHSFRMIPRALIACSWRAQCCCLDGVVGSRSVASTGIPFLSAGRPSVCAIGCAIMMPCTNRRFMDVGFSLEKKNINAVCCAVCSTPHGSEHTWVL